MNADDQPVTAPAGSASDGAPDDGVSTWPPPTPDGLGDPGRDLWHTMIGDLVPGWELDARELRVLAEACRTADLIANLDAAIEADGVTAIGSRRQTVVNPAVAEVRQQRAALASLLGKLDIDPPSASGAGSTAASARARKAAQARWRSGARSQGRLV